MATGVLALLAGGAAGVWVALRDDVRGVLVEEAEEVRRARELAATPVCEDAPSGFVTLNHPRASQDPAGAVEAGGGPIVELFDSRTKAVLYGSQLAGRFDVLQVHPEGRLDVMSSRVAGRMTMDGYNTTAAGDVDGDGLTDLIGVSPETSGVVIAWAGASDAFEVSHVQTVANVREVLSFDVDKDGRDDIVTLALNLGRPTVQWQRSLGRTLEPHRELRSGVDHIDAGRIAGNPSLVVTEGDGWLRLFHFGSVIGLTEKRDIARVVLADVVGIRMLGAEVVVWNDDVAIWYTIDPSPERAPCRMNLPGTEVSDVGLLNEDSVLDIVAVRSCSYCTSLYTVFLGRPSQDPQLAGSE